MSSTWVTPPAQATISPSQKIGTKVCTSALWSPDHRVVVGEDVPGRIFGCPPIRCRTMYLIASDIVWTWTMIPVERAIGRS